MRKMHAKTAVSLICLLTLLTFFPCSAEEGNKKIAGDVFSRTKNIKKEPERKKDLITSQRTSRTKTFSSEVTRQSVPSGALRQNMDGAIRKIDLYIGNCPFTKDAVKKVMAFTGNHRNTEVQYYIMKSNSNYIPEFAEMEGIEISLPVDADVFEISEIPAFIININGELYRASGSDVSLEDIAGGITKGSIRGERRKTYTDIGVYGKTCRTQKADLTPRELSYEDMKIVLRDAMEQPHIKPDMKSMSLSLPSSDRPAVINRSTGIPNYSGINTILVYSLKQSEWANNILKTGGAVGCCIDCIDRPGDTQNVNSQQICSKDMLDLLGVRSVPTIINIKEK